MTEIIEDAKGRKLKLRDVDPTYMLSLTEACEGVSDNAGFVRLASLYMLVDEIDGIPLPFPQNKSGIYAVAKLIGNEGVAALSAHVRGPKAREEEEKTKN